MNHFQALAGIAEQLADELRAVVRTDDGSTFTGPYTDLHCAPERLNSVFGFTYGTSVLADNHAIENVNYAEDIKETVSSWNITVLNIHLPQLVCTCDDSISRKSARVLARPFPLFLQDVQLFAQAVCLLFVQEQPACVTEVLSKELIAVDMLLPFEEFEQPLLNLLVINLNPCGSTRVAGNRTPFAAAPFIACITSCLPLLSVVVGRLADPKNAQNMCRDFPPLNKQFCYFESFE